MVNFSISFIISLSLEALTRFEVFHVVMLVKCNLDYAALVLVASGGGTEWFAGGLYSTARQRFHTARVLQPPPSVDASAS